MGMGGIAMMTTEQIPGDVEDIDFCFLKLFAGLAFLDTRKYTHSISTGSNPLAKPAFAFPLCLALRPCNALLLVYLPR